MPISSQDTATLTLHKLVFDVADLVFADVAGLLAELDLTEPQATMLWALAPNTPPMPMRELARKLRYDPSNVSLLGDQLQAAGLVDRQPHPTDGRRRVLTLTERGLKLWSVIIGQLKERSPLCVLSAEEQAELGALLQKVQAGNSVVPSAFLT